MMLDSAHTEDQTTDISPPSTSSASSSRLSPEISNIDKKILEWASKLEIEAVESREKSITLIDLLTKKKNELDRCVAKFEQFLKDSATSTNNKNDFDIMIPLIDNICNKLDASQLDSRCQEDGIKVLLSKADSIGQITKTSLHDINEQLCNTTKILASMSREMLQLSTRQIKMETTINKIISRQMTLEDKISLIPRNHTLRECDSNGKYNRHTPIKIVNTPLTSQEISFETTSGGSINNNNNINNKFYEIDGPITRARSRQLKRQRGFNNSRENIPVSKRPARTLIPWKDIDTVHPQANILHDSDHSSEL